MYSHSHSWTGTHTLTHTPTIQTLSQACIPGTEQTHTPCREGKSSAGP